MKLLLLALLLPHACLAARRELDTTRTAVRVESLSSEAASLDTSAKRVESPPVETWRVSDLKIAVADKALPPVNLAAMHAKIAAEANRTAGRPGGAVGMTDAELMVRRRGGVVEEGEHSVFVLEQGGGGGSVCEREGGPSVTR
jgi:hypothetical protein